jgi:hypothetical protein
MDNVKVLIAAEAVLLKYALAELRNLSDLGISVEVPTGAEAEKALVDGVNAAVYRAAPLVIRRSSM